MMHGMSDLYTELHRTHLEINKQIEAIKNDVAMHVPEGEKPDPDVYYQLNDGRGNFILADMLAAKAQVLSGMAALKAADVSSKAPRR